eukprot:maker-scaffold_17-snap-gene-2.4-mRNA-1 protein AED:0.34 eAED:0.34 QI:347/1/1/1/1/1/3/186/131
MYNSLRHLKSANKQVINLQRLSSKCSLSLSRPSASTSLQPFRSFSATAFLDETDVTDRVITVLQNFEKVDASKVTKTSDFSKDLGLDSLDAVEVVMAIEEEFVVEIPDAEAEKILTVEDAIKFIVAHPRAM